MNDIMILAVEFCDRLAADGTPIEAAIAFAAHRCGVNADELRTVWTTKLLEVTSADFMVADVARTTTTTNKKDTHIGNLQIVR